MRFVLQLADGVEYNDGPTGSNGVAPVNERLATDGDRVMVVTETTPWGLCRRFYDGRLVLVFSEYVFGESQGARRASA